MKLQNVEKTNILLAIDLACQGMPYCRAVSYLLLRRKRNGRKGKKMSE